nr:MAG TPA: hypothetical protein [Caudoviricetes sp.]
MTRRQEKICLWSLHRQTFHRFVTRTHLHPGGNANLLVCTSFSGIYAAKVTPGLQKRLTVLLVRHSL